MLYPNPQTALAAVPAVGGQAVDVSTTDWAPTGVTAFRSLWVGGTGAVEIEGLDGNNYTLSGVPAGTELRVAGLKVIKAGTTATLMVALL